MSNTDNWNTGNKNTGNWNTGNWNTGNWNTGSYNTGNCNTGHRNTGNKNTDNWNTGDKNTGNWNTGNWNTGDKNTGSYNTGSYNTGNWNTGDWNTGSCNTGYFNTVTPEEILVFNKPTKREEWEDCDKPNFISFNLTEWVDRGNMSEAEKKANPTYKTTGGYLKEYDYKEAFQKSYNKASEEDRKKIFNIPNFDADVFSEISGVDVRVDVEKESKKQALIRKAEELLKQAEEL